MSEIVSKTKKFLEEQGFSKEYLSVVVDRIKMNKKKLSEEDIFEEVKKYYLLKISTIALNYAKNNGTCPQNFFVSQMTESLNPNLYSLETKKFYQDIKKQEKGREKLSYKQNWLFKKKLAELLVPFNEEKFLEEILGDCSSNDERYVILADINLLKKVGISLKKLYWTAETRQLIYEINKDDFDEFYRLEYMTKVDIIHNISKCFKARKKLNKLYRKPEEYFLPNFLLYDFNRFEEKDYDNIVKDIEKEEKTEAQIKRRYKKNRLLLEKKVTVNGTIYTATIPKNGKELTDEGNKMHNCLVMRHPYVAAGQMRVIFLRKNENEPYIDIVLNEDDRIIWAITDYHKNVQGDDLKAVELWYESIFGQKKHDEMWTPEGFNY